MPASLKLSSANSSMFFSHLAARSRPGTASQFAAPQADTSVCYQRPPRPGLLGRALAPVVVLLQAGGALHGVVRRHATTIRAAICTTVLRCSASLSSSSEAPATSSGSHSTSELSSRGHLHSAALASQSGSLGVQRLRQPATQALPSLIALSRSLAAFTCRTIRSTPVRGLRKCSGTFGCLVWNA